jgi:hypothetical protein
MHSEINDPDTYHFLWFLCHEGFAQNLGHENEPPEIISPIYLISSQTGLLSRFLARTMTQPVVVPAGTRTLK